MTIDFYFKNLDSTEAIKSFATQKTEQALGDFFRGRLNVSWQFSIEKQNQIAHCHVVGKNMDYVGASTTTDLYASIEEALDKVEVQLRKHKEQVKDKRAV